jgi:hypothetical protein
MPQLVFWHQERLADWPSAVRYLWLIPPTVWRVRWFEHSPIRNPSPTCRSVWGRCHGRRRLRKWCRLFNGGRAVVHNETRFGRSSVITEDLKSRVDAYVHENRRFTIDELHEVFLYVSQLRECHSSAPIQNICARWVQIMSTDEHKQEEWKKWLWTG